MHVHGNWLFIGEAGSGTAITSNGLNVLKANGNGTVLDYGHLVGEQPVSIGATGLTFRTLGNVDRASP